MQTIDEREYRGFSLWAWISEWILWLIPEGYEDEQGFHYGRPPGERGYRDGK